MVTIAHWANTSLTVPWWLLMAALILAWLHATR